MSEHGNSHQSHGLIIKTDEPVNPFDNLLPKVQIRGRGVINWVASRLWVIDIT